MAIGKDIGWRRLSGEIVFSLKTGKELIRKVTIINDTDISCSVYFIDNVIGLKVSHHDAPTGETYMIKSISQTEFEKTKVHHA